MFACLRCYAAVADWVYVLLLGHCPECGGALEEMELALEEVLGREY